jgi:anti-sigma B factor antagonist
MELATEIRDGVLIISAPGIPLDHNFSQDFKTSLLDQLKDQTKAVLNLSRLMHMDSSGLGVLVACHQEFTKRGGDLRLCRVPIQIQAVFKVVRLASVFRSYNSVDEAVSSFESPEAPQGR